MLKYEVQRGMGMPWIVVKVVEVMCEGCARTASESVNEVGTGKASAYTVKLLNCKNNQFTDLELVPCQLDVLLVKILQDSKLPGPKLAVKLSLCLCPVQDFGKWPDKPQHFEFLLNFRAVACLDSSPENDVKVVNKVSDMDWSWWFLERNYVENHTFIGFYLKHSPPMAPSRDLNPSTSNKLQNSETPWILEGCVIIFGPNDQRYLVPAFMLPEMHQLFDGHQKKEELKAFGASGMFIGHLLTTSIASTGIHYTGMLPTLILAIMLPTGICASLQASHWYTSGGD
ncbi:hypothetical protein BYT27DRAFT_7210287 [Phlegmacium glaucopus]|nr:hypothetical protein BYT27DRAFT_7210287 [Phlegmacium glaucopus]